MTLQDIIKLKFLPEFGYWTAIPSNKIDRIQLNQSNSLSGKFIAGVKKRIIFTALFPLFSLIDTVGCLFKLLSMNIKLNVFSLFIRNKEKNRLYKSECETKLGTIKDLLIKSFFGFISSPLGILFYPQAVSFYHVHRTKSAHITTSGGGLYSQEVVTVKPKSVEKLSKLVKKANKQSFKLIPKGAGLSQGKQFMPTKSDKKSVVVDLSQFKDIEIDMDSKTATVGAGVLWSDLQIRANDCGLGVMVAQASNIFSVGGSIGTNIHGWDHITGSLGNTIESMTVVTPTGEIKTITPKDELFKLITGGFGLFGVVTQVKLKLTTNVDLIAHAEDIPIDDYSSFFKDSVQQSKNTRMHYYRLSLDSNSLLQSGIAVSYVEPSSSPQAGFTSNYRHEKNRGTRFERGMINLARRFSFMRSVYWKLEKRRLLKNTRDLITHNTIMHPEINAMMNDSVSQSEWLQEYFVPKENLAIFLKELGPLLTKNGVKVLNASVRHVGKDETSLMGYAKDGDRFAVVLCFNQSLRPDDIIKTKKWVQKSYNIVTSDKVKGSFYLPYQQFATAEQFDKSYPYAKAFADKKTEYDPNKVFSSGLHEQYVEPIAGDKTRQISIFKSIINNPDKKEQFKGFLHNILQRVDAVKLYPLLEDIVSYCDSHEDIYKELLRRRAEVMPSTFSTVRRQFKSLSDIRRDLVAQSVQLMGGEDRKREINGMMEIGYPGRFIKDFKKHFKVKGNITAVHEQESFADIAQTGLFKAHNCFVPLDYNKPDLSSVPTNSVELMTCFVGLHHIPENKLNDFLIDLRRILKPGGSFLLVDHDVSGEEIEMAQAAHAFFNAVNGFSWEDENSEVRNFRPMTYWQQKLAKHGLAAELGNSPNVELIREGDPSRNRMMRFINNKTLAQKLPLRTRQDSIKCHATTQAVAKKSPNTVANPVLLSTVAQSHRSSIIKTEIEQSTGSTTIKELIRRFEA